MALARSASPHHVNCTRLFLCDSAVVVCATEGSGTVLLKTPFPRRSLGTTPCPQIERLSEQSKGDDNFTVCFLAVHASLLAVRLALQRRNISSAMC